MTSKGESAYFEIGRALNPTAVTIVGASAGSTLTQELVHNLATRKDCRSSRPLHLVNRHRPRIGGIQAVASTAEVEGAAGLAIMMISPAQCLEALNGFRELPEAVVIYGGGAESGLQDAEQALREWAIEHRVPLLGPQSTGLVSTPGHLAAMIAPLPEPILPGNIALVMQSGALVTSGVRSLLQRNLGIHTAVSIGNGSVLGFEQVGRYLLQDPSVAAIGLYLEQIRSADAIIELGNLGQELAKPIVLLLGGVSDAGRLAAESHTGAVVTDRRIVEGISKQYGILVVGDADEMILSLEALHEISFRKISGGGVGIFSASGGGAIVMADDFAAAGVQLSELSPRTKAKLAENRAFVSVNPFDSGALGLDNPGLLDEMMSTFVGDPALTIIVYVAAAGLPTPGATDAHLLQMNRFVDIVRDRGKLGLIGIPAAQGRMVKVHRKAAWVGIPLAFGGKESACKARTLSWWGRRESFARHEPPAPVVPIREPPSDLQAKAILTGDDARSVLGHLPVTWPRVSVITSVEGAERAANSIGFPLVCKAESGLAHRAVVGGVLSRVTSPRSLQLAVEYLLEAFGGHVSISEYVDHGTEYVLGYYRDPVYGSVVMFGHGGVHIGTAVAFRRLPVTPEQAVSVVRDFVKEPLLAGAIAGVILSLQEIALTNIWIQAIDLNPITPASADGRTIVLDAKVHLIRPAVEHSRSPSPAMPSRGDL